MMLVVALMTMVSGCSKEALDPPCTTTHSEVKKLESGDQGGPIDVAGSGNAASSVEGTDGDTRGISDDGDDLSDSERGRKRRTN
jgi:hypothetical protein